MITCPDGSKVLSMNDLLYMMPVQPFERSSTWRIRLYDGELIGCYMTYKQALQGVAKLKRLSGQGKA